MASSGETRILHVISGVMTGGAERMLARLIATTQDSGVSSTVLAFFDGPMRVEMEAAGAEVFVFRNYNQDTGRNSRLGDLARRLVRREFDIVSGWMYHGNVLASAIAATCGRPAVWTIRQTLYEAQLEKPLTSAMIKIGALVSRHPRSIVYNSELALRQHCSRGYYSKRAVLIPNGFDANVFKREDAAPSTLRRELGIEEFAPLIGMFSRFHPMKDHGTFFAAAKRISSILPNARFLLVGRGLESDNKTVVDKLQALGLRESFSLLGERRDLPYLLSGIDILCLSSAWGEAFPNILGEAMSCETPCVTTDVGEAARIVGDAGKVIRPRDADSMAAGVISLLSRSRSDLRAIGVDARQRIKDRYSLDRVAESYKSLWLRVAGR